MSVLDKGISRRSFLLSCLAGAGAGSFAWISPAESKQPLHSIRWYSFGTLVDVTIVDSDAERVNGALKSLAVEFNRRNIEWHPWKPGTMLDINKALSQGKSIPVDEHMSRMVTQIKQLYASSNGAFNPAIGKAIGLWGFHAQQDDNWNPPSNQAIEAWLKQHPTADDLQLTDGLLSSINPSVQLDLGGYAKGYAIDLGLDMLQTAGIKNALINAGGDLVTLGSQGARPWRIGIRHPQQQGEIAWVESKGREAVFTSGNYERFHEKDGVRYTHIIHPQTGRPVTEIASASVIHENGAIADASATALVVNGIKNWKETAQSMGIQYAMIVDQHGHAEMTDAMKSRTTLV
jgi:FAD:protein FMN transferase